MRKEMCSFPRRCPDTTVKCVECEYDKRYVRADVAIRYGRMRERKSFILAQETIDKYCECRCVYADDVPQTFEEACAKRDGGTV